VRVAEGSLFPPSLDQPLAASVQLVADQARHQINGRHGFCLSLAQSSFEHGGHAAEPQLS
jgi:hypothetical protein